ncbi:ATP-binding protein [Corynebacterium camporealensis]
MMLRKPVDPTEASALSDFTGPVIRLNPESRGGWPSHTPLRWRLSLATGSVVAIAVTLVSLATFWLVSWSLTAEVDEELSDKATVLIQKSADPAYVEDIDEEIERFKIYNPDTRVSIAPPSSTFTYGDTIAVGGQFTRDGYYETATHSSGGERVVAKRYDVDGTQVVLARDMQNHQQLVTLLGTMLFFVVAFGVILEILSGMVVAKTGMQPLARLRRAANYIAETGDLRPIEVQNDDELGQLTDSFNHMLAALQESRTRQAQFVADAGHELKTPLTSMRTNIELLMMLNKAGPNAAISQEDMDDLEQDVMKQMQELSTLIGDLVDLAREDAAEKEPEWMDLEDVLDTSLTRVRRRRMDIHFDVDTEPWFVKGDPFALGRATLNMLDNAVKWSPADGTVRVTMHPLSDAQVRLRIDDSGPGIPDADKVRVFERFYRAPESRSMPGSGLGLAIVKAVVDRHEGTIVIKDAPGGGTRFEVILPGKAAAD